MEIVFKSHGNEKQKLAYIYWADNVTKDIAYGGSKGSGKSYLGCSLIFGDALMYPGTNYFIARKKLNDLRKFTVPTIYEVLQNFGITANYYNFNGQDNVFTLANGSKVFLLEAKWMPSDPLYFRFGSMQMTRGMIEEAGEFEEAAKNNLHASIGRWRNEEYGLIGKLIQTCNPAKNYLYRDYYKANKEKILPLWRKFIQALPQDNKKLPPGYLETLNDILDDDQKERLLKGNWEYDDDPAILIHYDSIINSFSNTHVQATGKRFITCDVARFGNDKTIIIPWDGWKALTIRVYPRTKVTETADHIKKLKKEYGVLMSNVIVDEDGIGGGVVDILGCRGFVANSRAVVNKNAQKIDSRDNNTAGIDIKENFDNLKSQCYFKLADKFNNGLIDLSELRSYAEPITEELEQVKQKDVDSDLKKGVIPKDKVKELIGRSPDYSDTLMMRMWFDLFIETGKIKTSLPYAGDDHFKSDFDLVR
ncbi:MAG TPA: phage terminase large subunit [Mucilaginibacter sp.]|jgi:hypothetical protein